jgi:uncharacterized Tic20 family protein
MDQQQMGSSSFLTGSPAPSQDDKLWGTIAHLSALVTGFFLFMPFLGPLLVMVIKGKESIWVNNQAKEALNFQILVTALMWIGAALTASIFLMCLGIPILAAGALGGLVLTIMAALKTNNGETFRYPEMLPRLVK